MRELMESGLPRIPHREFVDLTRLARSGDIEARETMIRSNIALVVHLAKYYTKRGLDLDDLTGHGMLGLVRAVDRFDPDHGERFSTFASHWIKQAIRRGIQNNRSTIRIPVHVQESDRRLNGYGMGAITSYDRQNARLVDQARAIHYVDRTDLFGEGESIALALSHETDPADAAADREDLGRSLALTLDLMAKLSPIERDVVRARLGIGQPQELVKQISARYHKSPRWSHWIFIRAIDRLRQEIGVNR